MKKLIISTFSLVYMLNAITINPLSILDNQTHLEWQDSYAQNVNVVKGATWIEALEYCENLTLDERTDWRLPNINELGSIVNRKVSNPAIKNVFQLTKIGSYWSSSVYYFTFNVGLHKNALSINFRDGTESGSNKTSTNSVRCVRDY